MNRDGKRYEVVVRGDWSPPLREVDVIERRSDIPRDVLRDVLEDLEIRVYRREGYFLGKFKNLLRGRGLTSRVAILRVDGDTRKKGGHGIFLGDETMYGAAEHAALAGVGTMTPAQIASIANMRGKIVVCLGARLGSPQMAAAFIKGGASAYIGTTGGETGQSAPRLFFALRFFYEMAQMGATVEEAWGRAKGFDGEAAKFRLYVPGTRDAKGRKRAIRVPSPKRSAEPTGARLGKRRPDRADWKPRKVELDVASVEKFPATNPRLLWSLLDQWGVKVNLHPCRSTDEVKQALRGRSVSAPFLLVESHGYRDAKGKYGIILEHRRRGKKGHPVVLNVDKMGSFIHLPGRVLLAGGCGLGEPETAKAFLKGGLRAYLGAYQPVNMAAAFIFTAQFFYELAVNRATVREAWERARRPNDETRLFRLYPGGRKVRSAAIPEQPVVKTPGLIEGFEGDTGHTWYGDWDTGFYEYRPGFVLPAPGGRPGHAFKLNLKYPEKMVPALEVRLRGAGQRWIGAKSLSLDVYVPNRLEVQKPLKCLFCVVGDKHEYSMAPRPLRRGWNHLEFAFDASGWRGKAVGTKESHREAFSLEKLHPVRWFWIAFPSTGHRGEGAVHIDNLRLE